MRKLFLFSIINFWVLVASGQQIGPLTQYSLNPYYYNTAAIGLDAGLNASTAYRNQWTGLEGSPKSFFINADMALHTSRVTSIFGDKYLKGHVQDQSKFTKKNKEGIYLKHALGTQLSNDHYGAFTQTMFQVSYALHLPFNKVGVSMGIAPGIGNIALKRENVTLLNEQDPTYNAYLAEGASTSFFNMNAGIYIYTENGYLGFSSDQLLKEKITFSRSVVNAGLSTHHFVMGGYSFEASEFIKVNPNFLVAYVTGLPTSWNVNTIVTWKDLVMGGIGYRSGDAVNMIVGYRWKEKYRFSYSYDINISKLAKVNSGSHEIMVSVKGLLTK